MEELIKKSNKNLIKFAYKNCVLSKNIRNGQGRLQLSNKKPKLNSVNMKLKSISSKSQYVVLKDITKDDTSPRDNFSESDSTSTSEEFEKKTSTLVKQYATKSMQNEQYRKVQEDRLLAIDTYNGNNGLFCIFDGHAGQNVVDNVHATFPDILQKELVGAESVAVALERAINKVQDNLEVFIEESMDEGCTATLAYVYKEGTKIKATVLNVGDSPCFFVSEGKIDKLTVDHNCGNAEELRRVQELGCPIVRSKLLGTLALTRSLGDFKLREYGLTADPHLVEVTAKEGDILLLGSDGVFEKLAANEILSCIEDGKSALEVTRKVIQASVEKKTRDNLSLIVLKF